MNRIVLSIQVEYEKGITPKKEIDLTEPLKKLGINLECFNTPYNVEGNANSPFSAGSAGYISDKPQRITLKNGVTNNTHVSLNLRGRFDKLEGLWNVDVYVNRHDPLLEEEDRRLITRRKTRIHKEPFNGVGKSNSMLIHWDLNGNEQSDVCASRGGKSDLSS